MRCNYLRNTKLFLNFLLNFWNLKKILNLQKKDDPHRFCISEITDSENVTRSMSKKYGFRRPFNKQHGKRAQALLKSALEHLYHIHRWLPSQLSGKTSLLRTCQILGLLVNTLAAGEKYPVLNSDNLMIRIQMQLSQTKKFFPIFCCIFEIYIKFWTF